MKNKKIIIGVAIAAVVLVGVMLLLIFLPKGGETDGDAASIDEGASITLSTDDKGVHQAAVARNSKGEVENNSYGTLMNYVPADISRIHIENTKGTVDVLSKTPEGEATVYTVEGYEDFELQAGIPDQIASAAASLSFTLVAGKDDGKNSAEYGFDSARSVATVTYNDGTKAIITVGSDAPQEAGTYIKFGDGEDIYVVDTEVVSVFDFGLTDLMTLTINSAAETGDNNQASSITVSGANFPETIELVPNNSEKVNASYKLTSPIEGYANEKESSLIEGGIRGLYADSVVMVNPSDSQLSSLGLSTPYARVKAVYPDETVELICSKPDQSGNICLMTAGGKVVYTLSASKAPWSETSYEKLVSEYALYPRMVSLSNMTITSGGNDYSFDLSSREVLTTDDDGEETKSTTTAVYFKGDEIQLENFSPLYNDASLIELADAGTGSFSGEPEFKITYTYAEDGSTDMIEFYPSDNNRYLAVLNGRVEGHARKSDITRVQNDINELVSQ